MSYNTTALQGIMQLLRYQNNYPALGTGSNILASQAKNLIGGIPPSMQAYTTAYQINLFGDYPNKTDVAPSILFTVVFFIILLAHSLIFAINYSRGHYFWLQLGWVFYCMCRVVGFAMRAVCAQDLSQTLIGISGEVFLILPSILLVSFNLILAQRIFTWRHPVGGSRPLFWNLMFTLYAVVTAIVVMTIVASAVPNLYFLSQTVYIRYQKVVMVSSIFVILYSLTSISLLFLAFFFKPTAKDESFYTYQPFWIESFSPTYFVRKGACMEAAETFMKRNRNHRHAVRVIAATHHHYNLVEGLTNQRGDLKHNTSMVIIVITTVLIFIGAIARSVVIFQGRYKMDTGPAGKPIVMYICWGAFEAIINILYLVGRVDLRFYRPDKLPKKVRDIVTEDQTANVSDAEKDDEDDDGHSSGNFGFTSDSEAGFGFQDRDVMIPVPERSDRESGRPPYPISEKHAKSEEFHF
ncbi:hypothetical protein DFJ63DRAFT_322229 [Scheffersomyces coipomensis]|uniref:uncharacterized protein n=1 Tax=Scheffersomyces coipomensis TaxID=1788519 RepID=UPI00315CBC89